MVEPVFIGRLKQNFRANAMKNAKIAEKDFDEWAELAKRDPSSFEQMRLAAIDQFIENAPADSRERLRRLQWRIDQERRLAHTPLNACIRLSRMMWNNVLGKGGLRERFEELGDLLQGQPPAPSAPVDNREQSTARVLAFARAND